MISINPKKILHNQETTWLALDLVMIGLLMVNLAWLVFDWMYATQWFPALVSQFAPGASAYYADHVHPNFWKIDLAFVTVFLGEFLLRWVVSIRRKTYLRWYFYPFIHWYELLGCIPLAGFRALRFLRVFSMLYRLQKLGVVDLRGTAPVQFLQRYYNVFVEEVSDRVVVNVLEGVQEELNADQPVVRRILNEVVLARKPLLIEQLGRRLEQIVEDHYGQHREQVSAYVDGLIAEAVDESEDVERLQRIPVFGKYGVRVLERTIAQIVFAVIDGAARDLKSLENRGFVEEVVSTTIDELLEHDAHFDEVTNEMLVDAIEILKEQARVQRWRKDFEAGSDDGSD